MAVGNEAAGGTDDLFDACDGVARRGAAHSQISIEHVGVVERVANGEDVTRVDAATLRDTQKRRALAGRRRDHVCVRTVAMDAYERAVAQAFLEPGARLLRFLF